MTSPSFVGHAPTSRWMLAAVDLPAGQIDARPVRVIGGRERRLDVVGGARTALATAEWRPSAPTTSCAVSVRRHHRRAPADAGHAVAVPHQLIEGEALAHLGAGRARRVDEQLVEQRAARAVDRVAPSNSGKRPRSTTGRDRSAPRTPAGCPPQEPRRASPSAAAARRRAPGPGGWRACRSGSRRGRRRGPSGRGARGAVPSRRRRRGPRPR